MPRFLSNHADVRIGVQVRDDPRTGFSAVSGTTPSHAIEDYDPNYGRSYCYHAIANRKCQAQYYENSKANRGKLYTRCNGTR